MYIFDREFGVDCVVLQKIMKVFEDEAGASSTKSNYVTETALWYGHARMIQVYLIVSLRYRVFGKAQGIDDIIKTMVLPQRISTSDYAPHLGLECE